MRLSALLATLTLVALLFAGCSGDGGGEGDGTSTSSSSSASGSTTATGSSTSRSSTGTTTSSGTTSTGPAANLAPTGSLSAIVDGTNVTFSLTGSDPDGDSLTWELDFGDGGAKATGDELPANLTHSYAVGNYTANFTVSDGTDAHSYDAAVSVAAAPAASAPTATMTGTVVAPDPLAAIPGGFCTTDLFAGEGTAGNAGNWWPVEPAWIGLQYTIEPASLLVTFFDGGGFPSGHGGAVPPGAIEVVVCGTAPTDVAVDFTLTIV